jgi:uncharacterized protein (TIGR02466 family)|tara:strand:- start:176 stop:793 length:618 start_codon:yes stop_codon:yes gene_type:complete
MVIENLFATKIWKRNISLDDDIRKNILEQIEQNYQKHKKYTSEWDCNVHSSCRGNNDIDYSDVVPILAREYQKFSISVGMEQHQYFFENLWYNYYVRGSNQEYHTHLSDSSLYSAVYFLKYDKEVHPPLTFYNQSNTYLYYSGKESTKRLYSHTNIEHSNMFGSYNLEASEGDFVIFPSSLPHGVFIQTSDEPRITISLNISLQN